MKSSPIVPHYSRKIVIYASVLLTLCGMARAACAAGPYEVDNVVAEADGKDATDARAKALAKGEKDAFAQLVLRLNPAAAGATLAKVTPSQVSASVRGFTVTEEKMSANHYRASLNYTFEPRRIETLMPVPAAPVAAPPAAAPPAPSAAAPPVNTAAPQPSTPVRTLKSVLVLPVYNTGDGLQLWQDDNKWRTLWYDAALESGGGIVVVPLGDLNDRVDVDDTNVTAATADSLKRMYDRYGVGEIDVLQAYFNPKADPKPALEVTLKRLLPGKPETVQMSYTIHSTETLNGLLTRASNDIAHVLYKQQTVDPTLVQADHPKEINARVNTNSIQQWQALRQHLLMRSNIVDIRFVSISYYETQMVITFRGTADMLGKTLAASGLRVLQDGDSLVLSVK